jgi:hypothetical protein
LPSASAANAAVENIKAATRVPIRLRISNLFLFLLSAGELFPGAKQSRNTLNVSKL